MGSTDATAAVEGTADIPHSKLRSRWNGKAAWVAIVVAIVSVVIFSVSDWLRSPAKSGKVMLAVLPFQSLSEDAQQEYVADGMTEEMITQLGGLDPQHLGVIARTSAMRYKAVSKDAAQVARELSVNYLLEGSVRRQGQRIRVSAQLIQAGDQTHIWADSYDHDVSDVLKLQSEVAMAIANQIRLRLNRQTERRLSSAQRVNAEAHEAYLRGQQAWNLRSKEGIQDGIEEFQRAVKGRPQLRGGLCSARAGLRPLARLRCFEGSRGYAESARCSGARGSSRGFTGRRAHRDGVR